MANLPTSTKLSGPTPPTSSPAASQVGPSSSGGDSNTRRSGGSGSFGAGQNTRSAGGLPRSKQAGRNQHKQSRRFRLADEDAIAESAAMRSFQNKKGQTSITHLMNFSLPPRPHVQPQTQSYRHSRRNPTWGLGSGYHSVDKARYVHANYRFIVDPRRDYDAQSSDADVYIEWSSVLQILASPLSQSSACPICLGDPVAPRMAKCGHIFCLHCLIRYMHSTDEADHFPEKRARWKKCPICWDSIYISETRPVRWYIGQEHEAPREGGDIVLRLVVRPAGSTLALPKEGSPAMARDETIPWHFAADVMDFARVMKGTEGYMTDQFDEEIRQIGLLEKHDELMFGEDSEWTGKAIKAINDHKDRIKGMGAAPLPSDRPEADARKKAPQQTSSPLFGNPQQPESALTTSISQFRQMQAQSAPPADYYFYQALLHYYLSPLDIRILKAAFGDFSNFPSTILPRVERVSTGHVVDDELRRRAKYLAHLPRGCEVAFLECDWTDTVPADTLNHFKADIEKRRKRNHDKDAREEKDRIRAEREEDEKRWAAARRKRPSSVDGADSRFRPDDFAPLAGTPAGADGSGLEGTSPMWSSPRREGSAFASLASPSTSPSEVRTVWGTAMIAPQSPVLAASTHDLPTQDDGWLQGWEKDLLDDNELVAQVEATSLGESSKAPAAAGHGAKKKKGKKITLMSTNARRGA